MINKCLLLSIVFIVMIMPIGCYIWKVLSFSNVRKSEGVNVIVDGSRLRLANSEIIVTNSLSISVRPTQKTSEWMYVYSACSEIWVNDHRLEINERSIKHSCADGKTIVKEEVKSKSPILFRFFHNKVVVAGSKTWVDGQVVIECSDSQYNVKVDPKKDCRVVVKGNWYEFTG